MNILEKYLKKISLCLSHDCKDFLFHFLFFDNFHKIMTADDQAPKKWRALFYGYVQTFWCQLDTCIMLGYDEKRSMILKKEGDLYEGH